MRPRFAVPASLLAALVAIVVPAAASAAPHRNHGLTINATPNPIVTGDPVLIYGQLNLPVHGGQTIRLFHRVNPRGFFTLVGRTTTDSNGFYEFNRADGVVTTNRSWFVRGPDSTHSRTVHERVAATLTLAASSTTAVTRQPITFTGQIAPAVVHAGERVFLQQQNGDSSDNWHTVATARIDVNSNYSITHAFRQPGDRELRVAFRGDVRNIRAVSDAVSVSIQQRQNPTFTINSSSPTIDAGQSVTISGNLFIPGSTTVPLPGTAVTLWGHIAGARYVALATTTTGTDGSFSFTQMPAHNEVYQVRTTLAPPRRRLTAQLYEGVRDVVTITASATTATVGQTVTFQGSVTPDKAGHVIYLEKLGPNGHFNIVEVRRVTPASTYSFSWTFGNDGVKTFRVRIPGGDFNVGGVSPSVAITVSLPAVQSLPPAS
jgi:hypothetical protein